jgi:tetratricopeptide (TPR) repeat protein
VAVPWQQSSEAGHRAVAGGFFDAAVANFRLAAESARKSGDQHALAETLRPLAKTYLVLGKVEKARQAAKEADEVDRVFWGYENQQVAEDMFLLGEALRRQGDFAGARDLFDRALTVRISLFGEAHVDSLAVMIKLILLDLQEGDDERLVTGIRQAAGIFSEVASIWHICPGT